MMDNFDFDELEGEAVNPSTETPLEVLISRRTLLKGAAATGAFGLFGCATGTQAPAAAASGDGSAPLTFTEIGRTED